jgi:hypothetical protein
MLQSIVDMYNKLTVTKKCVVVVVTAVGFAAAFSGLTQYAMASKIPTWEEVRREETTNPERLKEFIRATYDVVPPTVLAENLNEEFVFRMFQDPLVSYNEYRCLVRTLYYEAGSESVFGKIAVANIVQNRVRRNGESFCGTVGSTKFTGAVVQKKIGPGCHYDCKDNATRQVALVTKKGEILQGDYERLFHCARIAYDALANRLPNVVDNAENYWAPKVLKAWYGKEDPTWARSSKFAILRNEFTDERGMIGGHRFAVPVTTISMN